MQVSASFLGVVVVDTSKTWKLQERGGRRREGSTLCLTFRWRGAEGGGIEGRRSDCEWSWEDSWLESVYRRAKRGGGREEGDMSHRSPHVTTYNTYLCAAVEFSPVSSSSSSSRRRFGMARDSPALVKFGFLFSKLLELKVGKMLIEQKGKEANWRILRSICFIYGLSTVALALRTRLEFVTNLLFSLLLTKPRISPPFTQRGRQRGGPRFCSPVIGSHHFSRKGGVENGWLRRCVIIIASREMPEQLLYTVQQTIPPSLLFP